MKKIIFPALFFLFLTGCKGKLYRAPSSSMETTIMTGETFFVTRTNSFKRNDIVVFDYFGDDYASPPDENGIFNKHWERRFCRFIALSGDSLQIKNGKIIVNGRSVQEEPTILNEYTIFAKEYMDDLPERNHEYELAPLKNRFGDTIVYQVLLTKEEVDKYEQRKQVVIKIEKYITPPNEFNDTVLARPAANLSWTVDNYGPIYIPMPGDTIEVTKNNYKLYENIPGVQPGKNRVNEKLYFVMGDNRHRAQDSRYIGFISHAKMYGIVK